jgi:hypothetical protein
VRWITLRAGSNLVFFIFLKGLRSVVWTLSPFNYITTGAFTLVGPLLAPVVKHDFQMAGWALLIITKKLTLLKILDLPTFSYPLTFFTFHLKTSEQGVMALKGVCGGTHTPSHVK